MILSGIIPEQQLTGSVRMPSGQLLLCPTDGPPLPAHVYGGRHATPLEVVVWCVTLVARREDVRPHGTLTTRAHQPVYPGPAQLVWHLLVQEQPMSDEDMRQLLHRAQYAEQRRQPVYLTPGEWERAKLATPPPDCPMWVASSTPTSPPGPDGWPIPDEHGATGCTLLGRPVIVNRVGAIDQLAAAEADRLRHLTPAQAMREAGERQP